MSPLSFVVMSVVLAAALSALELSGIEQRSTARRGIAALGVLLALLLMAQGRSGLEWRSVELGPDASLICGVALLAFWALIGLNFGSQTPADGLAALATAPLILAVGAAWLVPQLLFLLCTFLAVAAERARNQPASGEMLSILLGLGAITAGLSLSWLDTEIWRSPAELAGPARWVLLAGVALAVLPPARLSAGRLGPGAPLLVAAGFSLVPRVTDGTPYAGTAVLGLALLVGAVSIVRRTPRSAVPPLPLLVLLGAALIAPGAASAAALGAVLIASTSAAGRLEGDPFKGVLVALAPLTIAAAAVSFALERALISASSRETDPAGWGLAAGSLLLGLGGCMWAGVATGRSSVAEAPDQIKQSVTAVAVGLISLAAAEPLTGVLPLGSGGGAVALILVAAAAGAAGTIAFAHREPATVPAAPASIEVMKAVVQPEPAPRWSWAGALVVGVASSIAALFVTVQGLKVGFL